MMPNPAESRAESRAAAEKLKAEGNASYQKQKWGAAVDVRTAFTMTLLTPNTSSQHQCLHSSANSLA